MVSLALRIFGLLLLVSGTAVAHGENAAQHGLGRRSHGDWAAQLRASLPRASNATRTRGQDASGRVWSNVGLGTVRSTRPAWITQQRGSWSYSLASDGTRCVSQRTGQSVFISCQ
jgi:hypothetical protein